jgi:hypothetical protein
MKSEEEESRTCDHQQIGASPLYIIPYQLAASDEGRADVRTTLEGTACKMIE